MVRGVNVDGLVIAFNDGEVAHCVAKGNKKNKSFMQKTSSRFSTLDIVK